MNWVLSCSVLFVKGFYNNKKKSKKTSKRTKNRLKTAIIFCFMLHRQKTTLNCSQSQASLSCFLSSQKTHCCVCLMQFQLSFIVCWLFSFLCFLFWIKHTHTQKKNKKKNKQTFPFVKHIIRWNSLSSWLVG